MTFCCFGLFWVGFGWVVLCCIFWFVLWYVLMSILRQQHPLYYLLFDWLVPCWGSLFIFLFHYVSHFVCLYVRSAFYCKLLIFLNVAVLAPSLPSLLQMMSLDISIKLISLLLDRIPRVIKFIIFPHSTSNPPSLFSTPIYSSFLHTAHHLYRTSCGEYGRKWVYCLRENHKRSADSGPNSRISRKNPQC